LADLSQSEQDTSVFSPAARRYALSVLVVVYTFNFIDRQILSILMEPIKADLGLSDTQLGLLTGFAFALFYATLGIPIARLADKGNRRNLIAGALTIWSAMTAVSSLAQNFWQLLGLSALGGLGGAISMAAASALVVEEGKKFGMGATIAMFFVAMSIGMIVGPLLGGVIADTVSINSVFYFAAGASLLGTSLFIRFTK